MSAEGGREWGRGGSGAMELRPSLCGRVARVLGRAGVGRTRSWCTRTGADVGLLCGCAVYMCAWCVCVCAVSSSRKTSSLQVWCVCVCVRARVRGKLLRDTDALCGDRSALFRSPRPLPSAPCVPAVSVRSWLQGDAASSAAMSSTCSWKSTPSTSLSTSTASTDALQART